MEYIKRKDAMYSQGHISKVVVIRISPGSDVIEGIAEACKTLNIKSGSVISCIGSLRRTSFMIAVPLNNKIGAGYGNPIRVEGPIELLSGQGTIGQEENGELFVHLHAVVSDKDGCLHGGHVVKGENPVLITCELTVAHIEGIQLTKSYDPEIDMRVLLPKTG